MAPGIDLQEVEVRSESQEGQLKSSCYYHEDDRPEARGTASTSLAERTWW